MSSIKERQPMVDIVKITLLDGIVLFIDRERLRGAIELGKDVIFGRWQVDPTKPDYRRLLTDEEKNYPEGTKLVIDEFDSFIFILPEDGDKLSPA